MNEISIRRSSRCAVVLFIVALPYSVFGQQPPSITVTERVVSIANVTKGGSIVLLSCSRTSEAGRLIVTNDSRLTADTDGDGSITFTPPKGVEVRSVWVAVDLETGAFASAAPANFPLVVRSLAVDSFRKDASGEIAELVHDLPRLFVVLVRPGKGAWKLRASDGGDGDRDRVADRKVTIGFEDMIAVGDSKEKGPKNLKADDVVIAIDPFRLDVVTARLSK
jgi:hypothetical protein